MTGSIYTLSSVFDSFESCLEICLDICLEFILENLMSSFETLMLDDLDSLDIVISGLIVSIFSFTTSLLLLSFL